MQNQKEATDKYTQEGYLYFSFDFLQNWNNELEKVNKKKNGKHYEYPDSMIRCCSKIKFAFQTGWRQVVGILSSLKKWIPIPRVPRKSQMSLRFNQLDFDYQETLVKTKKQNVALDSSGIKLRFSGQWVREKHLEKKPFLKIHVAINTKTNQAVAMKITEDFVSDVSQARKLLKQSNKISKVEKGFMDGAYDEIALWKWCEEKKIEPFIRLRKNAKQNGLSLRAEQSRRMHEIGFDEWMRERGMGEREPVECWYSVFKRRFGEFFMCRIEKNMIQEIKFKTMLCNQLILN